MNNTIKKFRIRRDKRIRSRSDDKWITMRGTHVMVDEGTDTIKAPRKVKDKIEKVGISKESVQKVLGKSKTEKQIYESLKKGGYSFVNKSKESGYPNFESETKDGKIRVYVKGKGRSAQVVVQEWKKAPEKKLRSAEEIKSARESAKEYVSKMKGKELSFRDLDDNGKYNYILAMTANQRISVGRPTSEAWSDAIDNAEHWKEKGFNGFESKGDFLDTEDDYRKYFEKIFK